MFACTGVKMICKRRHQPQWPMTMEGDIMMHNYKVFFSTLQINIVLITFDEDNTK